jgi:hypothetical protein
MARPALQLKTNAFEYVLANLGELQAGHALKIIGSGIVDFLFIRTFVFNFGKAIIAEAFVELRCDIGPLLW